jgi:hypothetical protein
MGIALILFGAEPGEENTRIIEILKYRLKNKGLKI